MYDKDNCTFYNNLNEFQFHVLIYLDDRMNHNNDDDEDQGSENEEGEENPSAHDEGEGDDASDENNEQNKLPLDPILRPENIELPGFDTQPKGWKLRVPPDVYQFYRTNGYHVQATHIPGDRYISLHWKQSPPTWTEFREYSPRLKVPDPHVFENDEVRQQVLAWVPNEWKTLVPTPKPYIPDEFSVGGSVFSLISFYSIFSSINC